MNILKIASPSNYASHCPQFMQKVRKIKSPCGENQKTNLIQTLIQNNLRIKNFCKIPAISLFYIQILHLRKISERSLVVTDERRNGQTNMDNY